MKSINFNIKRIRVTNSCRIKLLNKSKGKYKTKPSIKFRKRRCLRAKYTLETIETLRSMHGLDCDLDITNILAKEISELNIY